MLVVIHPGTIRQINITNLTYLVCGFLADGYGRRICIFIGCLIVLVGTAIQASANTLGQFVGGRFVLGFGASIASAAGPAYTVELAHPAYRGYVPKIT
jgi:MFS family permease